MATPRASFGSFTLSRPPSRAWSETTERPDSSLGPRSIPQEIEHIKRLITRSEKSPQPPSSITAVVFRNRKGRDSAYVGREQIFLELDSLKRRVKQELQTSRLKVQETTLVRRPSQIDPGQESESDVGTVFDERDEEVERLQEEVTLQRERLESLLEVAEGKVDRLSTEKDSLEELVRREREDSSAERDKLKGSLQKAQKRVEELQKTVKNISTSLSEQQAAASELGEGKQTIKVALETAQAQIAKLEESRSGTESSLAGLKGKVVQLERDNEQLADQLRKAIEARTASEEASAEQAATLREQLNIVITQTSQEEAAKTDLRSKLDDAEAQAIRVKAEYEQRSEELAKQVAELVRNRIATASELEDVKSQHASTLEELEKAKQTHQEELDKLASSHARAVAHANATHAAELQSADKKNANRVNEIHKSHVNEIERLRNERAELLDDLKDAHASELQTLKTDHEDKLRQLVGELGKAQREAQDAKASHEKQLEGIAASHQEQVASLSQEIEEFKHRLQELETARADLEKARVEKTFIADNTRTEAEKNAIQLQADHNEALESLRLKHAKDSATREEKFESLKHEHSNQISDLKAEHARAIDAMKTETSTSAADLREAHQQALETLRSEYERRLRDADVTSIKSHHERTQQHEVEMASLRESTAAEMATARGEHVSALESAEAGHRETLQRMQTEHEATLGKLSSEHTNELDALRQTMAGQLSKLEQDFEDSKAAAAAQIESLRGEHAQAFAAVRMDGSDALSKARELHAERMSAMQRDLDNMQVAHQDILQARLSEADASASLKIATLQSQHDRSLSDAQSELERLRTEQEEAMANIKRKLEAQLETTTRLHRNSVEELQASLQVQLEEAQTSHDQALAQQNDTWEGRLAELQVEHAKALSELLSNSNATTNQQRQQLEQLHANSLTKAVEDARQDAIDRDATVEQEHRAALKKAVESARSRGQAEVRNLKKRHQDAMMQIRITAQRQSAAQLTDLEHTHKKEMETALEGARQTAKHDREELSASHQADLSKALQNASESQQCEVMHLGTEYQSKLSELEARLREEAVEDVATKQASFTAQLEALQTRLEASLAGHADAERSLASVRQHYAQADRRILEATAAKDQEIVALTREKEDLTLQLGQVQASLRDMQNRRSSGTHTPRASIVAVRAEVADLHSQVAALEEERATMGAMLQKRLDENSEICRQNDFLVKELEMLLQQRSRPKQADYIKTDAMVQTESPAIEQKVDLASMRQFKADRRAPNSRPMTPLSPGHTQARNEIETAWLSRSFEDYLGNARAELSELGSAISANEALFARKIEEHVSGLQKAKDELTADYNARVEALSEDKHRVEKMVNAQQHAEFAAERRKLVAHYGADRDDKAGQSAVLTTLPVDTAVALRTAEQQLVDTFNQRISKRKSLIALKHAEEFHSITRDYDNRVLVLLNTRARLEGDLSVDPFRFEDEYGQIADQSDKLVAGNTSDGNAPEDVVATSTDPSRWPRPKTADGRSVKASAKAYDLRTIRSTDNEYSPGAPYRPRTSGGPSSTEERVPRSQVRSRTSNPRDSRSIPRATSQPRAFYPGSRDSPDATAQPQKQRRGSVKHPPIPQHSLMRTKHASDLHIPVPRAVSEPLSASNGPMIPPRGRSKSRAAMTSVASKVANVATNLSIDPSEFERQQQQMSTPPSVIKTPATDPPKSGFLRRIRDKFSSESPNQPQKTNGFMTTTRAASMPLQRSQPRSVPSTHKPAAPAPVAPASAPARAVPAESSSESSRNADPHRRSRSSHFSSGMIYNRSPARRPDVPPI